MADEQKTTREASRTLFEGCDCKEMMSRMMAMCGCGDEAEGGADEASGKQGKASSERMSQMMSRMMAMCGCGDEAEDGSEATSREPEEAQPVDR